MHAPLHTPAAHVGEATLLVEHTLPQPPQLPAPVNKLASQPLAGLPSQSAKFVAHTQAYDPTVLLHTMLAWQVNVPAVHSLTSLQLKPSPL